MVKNKYLSLGLILLVTFSASAIGSFVTYFYKEPWYSEIILPGFNPPSWVFGPVWTTLYVLMSIAIWLAWRKTLEKKLLQKKERYPCIKITFQKRTHLCTDGRYYGLFVF